MSEKKTCRLFTILNPNINRDLNVSPSKIIIQPSPQRKDLEENNQKLRVDNAEGSRKEPFKRKRRVNRRLNFEKDQDQESYNDCEEKSDSSSGEPYQDSGSEYVPSEIEEEIGYGIGVDLEDIKYPQQIETNDERQHFNDLDYSPDNIEALGDDVSVKTKRSKGQACLFCGKLVIQLPRHFERKHAGEPEIMKLMSLTKKSPERLKMLDCLKKNVILSIIRKC